MRNRHIQRLLTDAAGYGLILAGVAFGWLPGPGGIPLILAGLGLLAINNVWAARLRTHLLKHGGKATQWLFPSNRYIQLLYDFMGVILFLAAAILAWHHASRWEISIAASLFLVAMVVIALNRGRYTRVKHKHK